MPQSPGAWVGLLHSKLLRLRSEKFYQFCTQLGKIHPSGSPCPVDEWTLCLFTTLANTVQHSTIRCICLRSARCISTRAFRILSLIVCGCSRCSVVLRELRAILLLNGYQSLTMSWLLSSQLSTSMAVIIACFGQHVAWYILAFFALRNSPFPIWPVWHHPSILVWLISLWTPIHHPRAFALGLKHLKRTRLGRDVSCI